MHQLAEFSVISKVSMGDKIQIDGAPLSFTVLSFTKHPKGYHPESQQNRFGVFIGFEKSIIDLLFVLMRCEI